MRPRTRSLDVVCGPRRPPVDLQDIVVLDAFRRHPVRTGLLTYVVQRASCQIVRVDCVGVVLADECDRQFLQGGEVHAFVEHALVHGTVPEEDGHHPGFAPDLEGIGVTHRVGDGGADDRRRPGHALFEIDEMHRAALAARAPGHFPVELGDHRLHVAALGQVDVVSAVGAEYRVADRKRLAHSRRDSLLTDGEVHRALDLVAPVDVDDSLFDAPYAQHGAIEPFIQRRVAHR